MRKERGIIYDPLCEKTYVVPKNLNRLGFIHEILDDGKIVVIFPDWGYWTTYEADELTLCKPKRGSQILFEPVAAKRRNKK